MSNRRILIVDDESEIRSMLSRQLSRIHGEHTILVASTSAEALKIISDENPRVIVLDVMMPEMTGIELSRKIRQDPKNAGVYIILFTGRHKGMAEGIMAGADAYLDKSNPFEDLQALIDLGLDKTRSISVLLKDPETGFWNESCFRDILLPETLLQCSIREHPCLLFVISLNLPKNKVLNELFLRANLPDLLAVRKQNDVTHLTRLGKSKFGILMPDVSSQWAIPIARRIQGMFQKASETRLSPLSIGVASFANHRNVLLQAAETFCQLAEEYNGAIVFDGEAYK